MMSAVLPVSSQRGLAGLLLVTENHSGFAETRWQEVPPAFRAAAAQIWQRLTENFSPHSLAPLPCARRPVDWSAG